MVGRGTRQEEAEQNPKIPVAPGENPGTLFWSRSPPTSESHGSLAGGAGGTAARAGSTSRHLPLRGGIARSIVTSSQSFNSSGEKSPAVTGRRQRRSSDTPRRSASAFPPPCMSSSGLPPISTTSITAETIGRWRRAVPANASALAFASARPFSLPHHRTRDGRAIAHALTAGEIRESVRCSASNPCALAGQKFVRHFFDFREP
jgi:hypothetical protein